MKQRKKSFGMRISAFVLSFAMVCTLLAGVNVVAFAADGELTDTVAVQKFYNDAEKGGTGEHIYTIDESEISWYQSLPSWNDEGDAWLSPLMSSTPVYRVFNPNSGEHLWITDKGYVDLLVGQGWNQEQGIAFYSDDNKGVPVYRLWDGTDNLRSHHYTTDEGEIAWLVTLGWTVEDVAFYGVKEEEPGEKEMTALQTGASEITVVSESEFAGTEEFTVTTALGEEAAEFVFLDENTVVITLESPIVETEYTVTCSDIEYEPASFVGEEAEVTNFMFVGEQLVLAPTQNEAYIGYATLDQWGDPIVDVTVDFRAGTYEAEGDGEVLTVSNSGAAIAVGTKIPVAVVYADGTKVVNTTLEVVNSSVVANMTVGDFTINPNLSDLEKLALLGKRVTSERLDVSALTVGATNYVLPIEAYDQYGNKLNALSLNIMASDELHTLYVTNVVTNKANAGVISAYSNGAGLFVEDEEGNVYLPVVSNGSAQTQGTGALNFLSLSGFTTSKSVVVNQNEMIDTIDVTVGELVQNQPAPIGVSVRNQYGEDVTEECIFDTEVVVADPLETIVTVEYNGNADSTISVGEGCVAYNEAYETVFVTSYNTPSDFLTVSPVSGKVAMTVLSVKGQAVPTKIKGVTSDSTTTLGGATEDLVLDTDIKFDFLDQYSQDWTELSNVDHPYIPAYDGVADYYYTVVKTSDTNYTTFNAGTKTISITAEGKALTTAKTETYKATLHGPAGYEMSKLFTVTIAGKPQSFVAETVATEGLLYVGTTDDRATINVYGVDASGNKFMLDQDEYTVTLTVNESFLATTGTQIAVSTAKPLNAGAVSGAANVKVWINGVEKTTVSVPYSNATPTAQAILVLDAGKQTTYTEALGAEGLTNITTDEHIAVLAGVGTSDGLKTLTIMPVSQYGMNVLPANAVKFTVMDSEGFQSDDDLTAQGVYNNEDAFIIVYCEIDDQEFAFVIGDVSIIDPTP